MISAGNGGEDRLPQDRGSSIPTITRHARLRRDYPGERLLTERALAGRLHGRDRELRIFEGLVAADTGKARGDTRRTRRTADPSPNAPLLIRIVRYPYRQETHRGRRRTVFQAGMPRRQHAEQREAPMRSAMVFRGDAVYGNPIKALDIHPSPLPPPPSVDSWLATAPDRPTRTPPPGAA